MLDKRVSHVSIQVSVLYVFNYIMHKQIISENITSKDYINQGTKVTTQFFFILPVMSKIYVNMIKKSKCLVHLVTHIIYYNYRD